MSLVFKGGSWEKALQSWGNWLPTGTCCILWVLKATRIQKPKNTC